MKRNVSLDEISDGKLYLANDLVKANCNGCKDCFSCCQKMGSSIILDPLDSYRLQTNLGQSFEQLMAERVELQVVDGIILPNLKMLGEDERCSFLNENGRCSIHSFRPGICRLFPLGRYYENNSFQYFLQIHECRQPNKTKVKISKWIDTPNLKDYEAFITDWHYFLKGIENQISLMQDDTWIKNRNMNLLKLFYIKPYEDCLDFYTQFYSRLKEANKC
jgi:uncharacterized protein